MNKQMNDKTRLEKTSFHGGLLYLQIQLHKVRRDIRPRPHLVSGSSRRLVWLDTLWYLHWSRLHHQGATQLGKPVRGRCWQRQQHLQDQFPASSLPSLGRLLSAMVLYSPKLDLSFSTMFTFRFNSSFSWLATSRLAFKFLRIWRIAAHVKKQVSRGAPTWILSYSTSDIIQSQHLRKSKKDLRTPASLPSCAC